MRPDDACLADLLDAADAIGRMIENVDREALLGDELLRKAVLLDLIMVEEAAAALSSGTKAKYPEIGWVGPGSSGSGTG